MTPADLLLLRASDCPGILDGWCGPVDVSEHHPDSYAAGGSAVWWVDRYVLSVPPGLVGYTQYHHWRSTAGVRLDLSRPEARDHAARWLAAAVGLECGATAPLWYFEPQSPHRHDHLFVLLAQTWCEPLADEPAVVEHQFKAVTESDEYGTRVPALAAISPQDPNSAALALAACCVHVGGARV